MTPKLNALITELAECDRRERIELLIDLARDLPELPTHLEPLRDEDHRVPECQSPVFLFVECEGDKVRLHADVPVEAPTVRGFVAMLVQGLDQAHPDQIISLPHDVIQRSGIQEILGMQRVHGLHGVLSRLKAAVVRAHLKTSKPSPDSP